MEIVTDFIRRLTSRKFIVAAAAYSIVLLAGLGYAEFDREVVAAASVALVAYLGVEGAADYRSRQSPPPPGPE